MSCGVQVLGSFTSAMARQQGETAVVTAESYHQPVSGLKWVIPARFHKKGADHWSSCQKTEQKHVGVHLHGNVHIKHNAGTPASNPHPPSYFFFFFKETLFFSFKEGGTEE